MKFCSATTAHYDQIIDMVSSPEELYLFYPKGRYPLDSAQLDELFRLRSNFTVAIANGEVVGFANLYHICPEESAFIGNVLVSQAWRGKGLGKRITEYMCEVCMNEYQATPRLSVFNYNTRALLMYTQLGFKPYAIEQREGVNLEPVALIHMQYER
ncbi:GNAT family N-acetyltransferase [Motilimonas eburnea]|uniref:GNAT family N-acetyltransferase n=1 Tax=Motilimonas eburnea TaxID=1737488 RepID=UPI001E4DACE8|nr:GNAT family N-acetyltransferase [Motilimonas eburnea]MCE2572359.1 GNAT family N-acetyltransferase [Motilimonas eburnea]